MSPRARKTRPSAEGPERAASETTAAAAPTSPAKPVIIIDTREQQPWNFSAAVTAGLCTTERRALCTGDYSVQGYEDVCAIERKSLDDFVSSITAGRERFFRELERLRALMFPRLVIEASLADVLARRYTSKATPSSVLGTAVAIDVDLGIPVVWAGDRPAAREYAERLLLRVAKRGGGLQTPHVARAAWAEWDALLKAEEAAAAAAAGAAGSGPRAAGWEPLHSATPWHEDEITKR